MSQQKKPVALLAAITLLLTIVLSACSGAKSNTDASPSAAPSASAAETGGGTSAAPSSESPAVQFPTDPVTLKFLYPWGEEFFNKTMKAPVEAKFPHITLEYVGEMSDEDISQGIVPDIIYPHGIDLKAKKLTMNLEPFIEKYGVQDAVAKIDPVILEHFKYNDDGQITRFPLLNITFALHYNKDIFDKLGVDYPKDGMTWEEVIELAKQLTRNEGGVQYRGLDLDYPLAIASQFPMKLPETLEPTFNTINKDYYSQMLDIARQVLQIPGNYPDDPVERSKKMLLWGHAYLNEKNVAMYPYWSLVSNLAEADKAGSGFNWDLVTYPELSNFPDAGPQALPNSVTMSPLSSKQDAAFQVLTYLISEEYQIFQAKEASSAPILNVPAVQQAYADNFPGKNIAALFKLPQQLPPEGKPIGYNYEYDVMWNGMYEFAKLEKDNNTLLREWHEQAQKKIQENQGQQ